MNENILERILRAESEFDQKLEKVQEQAAEYESSVGGKRGEKLQALQRERLAAERSVNEKFRLAYTESEKVFISTTEKHKETLRLSKEKRSEAIAKRLKDEILKGLLSQPS